MHMKDKIGAQSAAHSMQALHGFFFFFLIVIFASTLQKSVPEDAENNLKNLVNLLFLFST